MEQSRKAYKVLVRNPEGRIPLGRRRCRWEDNIKMDFRDVDCVPGDWMALAEVGDQWPACAKAVMNHRFS